MFSLARNIITPLVIARDVAGDCRSDQGTTNRAMGKTIQGRVDPAAALVAGGPMRAGRAALAGWPIPAGHQFLSRGRWAADGRPGPLGAGRPVSGRFWYGQRPGWRAIWATAALGQRQIRCVPSRV
jgi:hypothetical protein